MLIGKCLAAAHVYLARVHVDACVVYSVSVSCGRACSSPYSDTDCQTVRSCRWPNVALIITTTEIVCRLDSALNFFRRVEFG